MKWLLAFVPPGDRAGIAQMGLLFGGGLVISVLLAVLITGNVARDGRSDWLRGVQLLAVCLILGGVFYLAPDAPG